MRQLLDIFIASFKVGLMTFGGGYAMLPILQREVVESRKWVTEEEVLDFYAIGQCLPGIIMVNTMIFIGQKRRGTLGGIVAALGTVCPALIIITIIAAVSERFCRSTGRQKRLCGHPCLRLRFDIQRRYEAVEKLRHRLEVLCHLPSRCPRFAVYGHNARFVCRRVGSCRHCDKLLGGEE